jgi:hypothetical protein
MAHAHFSLHALPALAAREELLPEAARAFSLLGLPRFALAWGGERA